MTITNFEIHPTQKEEMKPLFYLIIAGLSYIPESILSDINDIVLSHLNQTIVTSSQTGIATISEKQSIEISEDCMSQIVNLIFVSFPRIKENTLSETTINAMVKEGEQYNWSQHRTGEIYAIIQGLVTEFQNTYNQVVK